MSDRFRASIPIVGTLTRREALGLCRTVPEEGACLHCRDGGFHPRSAENLQTIGVAGFLDDAANLIIFGEDT